MSLSDIQQSFYTRSFKFASVETWLIGLAVVVALLLAYLAYKAIQARRVRYDPHGSIVDPRVIRTILHTAFDQRRPFEVQVQTDAGQRRPTLRCSPVQLGQTSLTVEINGLKSLSERWLNRQVTVFFRIMAGKDFTYYTFPSRIVAIDQPRQGVCHISLPMPEGLENRQKRSFLRIAPPKEHSLGAALWYGANMPPPEKLSEIALWPAPLLLALPERVEQFTVVDLSAGGARLRIPHEVAREMQVQFNSTEQIMLMIDLFDPEQNKRLRFWLQCRIQNVWVEHPSRDIHMGVQCLAWGKPKELADQAGPAGSVEWLRLSSSNEVEPLGNWIMRRHLELFRDHPLEFF